MGLLSIIRKIKKKEKEMRILMVYVFNPITLLCLYVCVYIYNQNVFVMQRTR